MVACGFSHTACVTDGGVLWSWGHGDDGRLGHGDLKARLVPEPVEPQRFNCARVAAVACGARHSAAVTKDGALFTWGRGYTWGRGDVVQVPNGLGHDDLEGKLVPTLVAPHHLLGARVGRCCPLPQEHAVAIAMGTHGRLGSGSAIALLAGEPGLVQMVADVCRWRPKGDAGGMDGVVRLMGGGPVTERSEVGSSELL